MYDDFCIDQINPYIRYVNNFSANYDHKQLERVIYDYEFMYILEGSITIYYDNKIYDLGPSDLFYFSPGVKNHMETKASVNLKTHCIHFDWVTPLSGENFHAEDYYLNPVLHADFRKRLPILQHRSTPAPTDFTIPIVVRKLNESIFKPLFAKCYNSFLDQSPLGRLMTKQCFYKIIVELYKTLYEKEKTALHPKVKLAIQYINNHYTEEITTEGLAATLSISPKYFGSIFKESIGKSVNEYVHELRMFNAKQMLLGSNTPIHEIAYALGYSNEFYFSNKFRQLESVSPKYYREGVE